MLDYWLEWQVENFVDTKKITLLGFYENCSLIYCLILLLSTVSCTKETHDHTLRGETF